MPSSAAETAHQIRSLLGRAGERLRSQVSEPSPEELRRWLVVTIEGTPEDIAPGGQQRPPLAELEEDVEIEMRPAPGGRGTELAARVVGAASPSPAGASSDARNPRANLRQALRQVKQLTEVGEVLVAEPRPEGYRPRTLPGLLVDKSERKSDKGGVL